MTVKIQEHLDEMRRVKANMKAAKGWRHECLLRQYNRMAKELKTAQAYLRQREEAPGCRKD